MNEDTIFQILDWNYYHEEVEPETEEKDEKRKIASQKEYIIRLFGRTNTNKTIYVKVNKFTPYFYIEIDENWRSDKVNKLINYVKDNVTIKSGDSWVKCGNGLIDYKIENHHKFRGFTNFKKFTFVKLIFNDLISMRGWAGYFKKKRTIPGITKKAIRFQIYESNIEPFIRCIHIRDLDAVGWVKISNKKIKKLSSSETCCDINIETNWVDLNRLETAESKTIQPFIIAAFDIECTSEDGSFPQAHRSGDKIIQIGTTFSRFGESECFYQHIITLGTCDKLEGATVVECKNEKKVLLEWSKMIRQMNPDIITGYNIFGFDYKYLKDRAKFLNIEDQFSQLSRISDERTGFVKKDLSSAALGKNIMTYYDMTGRVNVDLMKVVQRDYKLMSYKLDYVASYFIREEVIKMYHKKEKTYIITKSIYGVKKGQYITIFYNDGITDNRHMDGNKFKIINFIKEDDKDVIVVDGLIDLDIIENKGIKIYWCQAKDDVSAKDIFRLQKGSSEDRAIIAKYCLMDCELCNKLMAKLCV